MTDRIDHAAEALGLRILASECSDQQHQGNLLAAGQIHATLALVEQQRIANLISLAGSTSSQLSDQTAEDAAAALLAFHRHEEPAIGGWFELQPDVAAALGIDTEGSDDADS